MLLHELHKFNHTRELLQPRVSHPFLSSTVTQMLSLLFVQTVQPTRNPIEKPCEPILIRTLIAVFG